jgi:hypothetical protein
MVRFMDAPVSSSSSSGATSPVQHHAPASAAHASAALLQALPSLMDAAAKRCNVSTAHASSML